MFVVKGDWYSWKLVRLLKQLRTQSKEIFIVDRKNELGVNVLGIALMLQESFKIVM